MNVPTYANDNACRYRVSALFAFLNSIAIRSRATPLPPQSDAQPAESDGPSPTSFPYRRPRYSPPYLSCRSPPVSQIIRSHPCIPGLSLWRRKEKCLIYEGRATHQPEPTRALDHIENGTRSEGLDYQRVRTESRYRSHRTAPVADQAMDRLLLKI